MKSYYLVIVLFMLSGCSQGTVDGAVSRSEFDLTSRGAADQRGGSDSALDAAASSEAEAILAAVNVRRALTGIPPLIQLPELTAIASRRSIDMAVVGYLGHVDPITGKVVVEQLLQENGFKGQAAELLYHSQGALAVLANEVVEAWFMNSDHRLVLLSPEFRYSGIGIMGDGQAWIVTAVVTGDRP